MSTLSNVRVRGICCAVPDREVSWESHVVNFGEEAKRISLSTGICRRVVASPGVCTSDLCQMAAERLLLECDWSRHSVDLLIFVSQTPDYVLPATACALQARLGLAKHCAAFDVNLGCSGYTYGLWLAASLIAAGSASRALLLVGDTVSRLVSEQDRATAMLFGDAGSATVLERTEDGAKLVFQLGTDGEGERNLVVPAGGFRQPRAERTARRVEREGGNMRSDEELYMNGSEVFSFSLREVPHLLTATLSEVGWTLEHVEQIVMHQANRFMLQHLAKRLKVPAAKMPIVMESYGNTSSASIPLALVHSLRDRLQVSSTRLLLVGFGVGWSWAAAAFDCGPLVVPPMLRVPTAS